ncbi:MAG TPA: hypothetical protein VI643_03260, partial [Planctomycetota bacterium]|nr:hypothetical protein [Planctomycetota bacterium]
MQSSDDDLRPGREVLYVAFIDSAEPAEGVDSATETEIRHDWRPKSGARGLSVVYWHDDEALGIGAQTFKLDHGRVFLLRVGAGGVASIRQVDVPGPSFGAPF